MIGWFRVLVDSNKFEVIGLYLLVIILAIAWARFIAKKHDARRVSILASYLGNQGIKNHKKDNNGTQERDTQHKLEKRHIIWSYLLSKFCYKARTDFPYYQTDNERDEQKQPSYQRQPKNFGHIKVILRFPRWHISAIVKRLYRRVNQSGKEPHHNEFFP